MSDDGPLRDRQRNLTREAIIEAFLELSHAENAVTISIPAVAERAGVSVRTIYRHFPTKSALQTDAAYHYSRQAERTSGIDAVDATNVDTYLRQLWTDFAAELPAVMAEHATPAGRELRAARLPQSRAVVAAALPGQADPELIDMVIAVASSSMFLELVDRMSYPAEKAAEMTTRLIQLLISSAEVPNIDATDHQGEAS